MSALFFTLCQLVCIECEVAKFDKMSLERFFKYVICALAHVRFRKKAVNVHG